MTIAQFELHDFMDFCGSNPIQLLHKQGMLLEEDDYLKCTDYRSKLVTIWVAKEIC